MIDVTTIIFALALLGIVGMIFLKVHEVKTGKPSLLSRLGQNMDRHVHDAYDAIKYFLSHLNKRTAILAAQWVAFHLLTWLRKLYFWLQEKAHSHPHSKKVIDMVTGHGDAHKNNGSSFYLKHIAADAPKPVAHATATVAPSGVVHETVQQPVAEVSSEIVAETPEK